MKEGKRFRYLPLISPNRRGPEQNPDGGDGALRRARRRLRGLPMAVVPAALPGLHAAAATGLATRGRTVVPATARDPIQWKKIWYMFVA